MSRVTKFEMDEKLSKMNNLIMSFMDYTNNKMKLMEEEIKQHKDKINILENELNETKTNKNKINILEKKLNNTKTNNQKYKNTIYTSEYDLIYDINRNIDALDERLVVLDEKYDALDEKYDALDEKYDEHDEKYDALDEKYDERLDKIEEKNDVINEIIDSRLNHIDKQARANYNSLIEYINKTNEIVNFCKQKILIQ